MYLTPFVRNINSYLAVENQPPVRGVNNNIRDRNLNQGVTHPTDLTIQPPRDISKRYVSIQNSGLVDVRYSITPYSSGPLPKVSYLLESGETHHLDVNSIGDNIQFLWVIDPVTKKSVSQPTALRTDAQDFVLRHGVNKWWVDFFKRSAV